MNMRKCAVLALSLMAVAPAIAEQRFYQVMDAQGRIQTVTLPDEPANKPSSSSDAAPASSVAPAVPAAPGTVSGVEPVDTQEYLDSEELERSNFNPEKKKRFYLLNDGMGSRIEESSGAEGGNQPDAMPMFMAPEKAPVYVKVLHAAPVEVQAHDALLAVFNGSIRKSPEGKPLCLGKAAHKKVEALTLDVSATVVIDSKARHFLEAGGVVSVFSVAGEGLRSITVQSVSHSDRKPAFVEPVFAYADAAGCVIRATAGGYFEHWLAATNSRHPLLEGRLTMLSGERFLLVVLPDGRTGSFASDFPSSTDGVLAVKWHEQHEK